LKSECQDLELIENREILTEVCIQVTSLGQVLICHSCDDIEEVIVGFLVHGQSEQAWALCGSCLRKLSSYGAINLIHQMKGLVP
jgi:hypothetical protein